MFVMIQQILKKRKNKFFVHLALVVRGSDVVIVLTMCIVVAEESFTIKP